MVGAPTSTCAAAAITAGLWKANAFARAEAFVLCTNPFIALLALCFFPLPRLGSLVSVLEVGSSQGYLLRHLELRLFPSATILHGLDIDSYAVAAGSAYLRSLRSRVKLFAAEMETAEHVIGGQVYDVVLCCGVLMYVNESIAEKVIRDMFSRARFLVGLICLAPLETASARSVMRALDGAFIHNMDLLIRRAGGRVVSSNLIDTSISGSSSSHVIVGEPARRAGSLIAS